MYRPTFDITHTLKESQGGHLDNIQTTLGQRALQKGLTQWSTSKKTLERRANNILLLRKFLAENPEQDTYLQEVFENLQSVSEIFEPSESVWKDKTSEQIFFETGGLGGFLNHIPGIVAIMVFMKVWLAPALAIATPFIMFVLPYFMLQFMYNVNISWSKYQSMALDMFIGERSFNLHSLGKILYFVVSLSQTIIQPFLTSIAVRKLDVLVQYRGEQLNFCYSAADQIFAIFREAGMDSIPHIPKDNESEQSSKSKYVLFARDKDERWSTLYLGQLLGDAEVLYCLARDTRFTKTVWLPEGDETVLEINTFHDISIKSDPKTSSIKFTTHSSHSLLTGPNRGGKSSNLRGILQNVLWAQTYGLAPCHSYKGKLFSWIVSSLRVEDRPGASSLFEREIEIATDILRRNQTGLVLIDEIFHSTNPPDGEKSARIFLEQLWSRTNIVSCVSTHVYSIVEDASDKIQRICCFAKENEDKTISYGYTLQKGICKVSSVDDVLREKGLVRESVKESVRLG